MTFRDAVGNWWLTNARIKHGHPPDGPANQPQETQPMSNWKKTALAALASAVVGGGVAAPLAAWWLSDSEQPAVERPSEQQSGSLYQYLEDNGYHVE